MKIAEFFAELGFDIKGDKGLAEADKTLSRIAVSAVSVLGAVAALNAGFAALVDTTLKAAIGFKNFELSTGLSVDQLRAWQHFAETNDVTAGQMTDTIKGLQSAMAEIRLGRGNIQPWQLLGISPNTDPFTVLEELRKRLQDLPPDMARVVTAQMGIGDAVFQMLRSSSVEFEKLDRRLVLTAAEQTNLIRLNRTWKDLVFSIGGLRDRIVAQFAQPMKVAVDLLKAGVNLLVRFVDWLGSGSIAATGLRVALWLVVGAFLGLTLAAGALSTVLAGLSLILKLMLLPAGAVVIAFTAFLAVLILTVGAVAGLLLMLNDFWAAIAGKKHLFNWQNEIDLVNELAAGIEELISLWNRLKGDKASADFWSKKASEHARAGVEGGTPQTSLFAASSIKDLIATIRGGGSTSNKQENHVTVSVNGATDPGATGSAVGSEVKRELAIAAFNFPVSSW